MGMLDKRSLKLESVQDWSWAPAGDFPLLAAYQAEQGNLPARVALIRLPDREELRQKNLFSVAGGAAGCGLIVCVGMCLVCG